MFNTQSHVQVQSTLNQLFDDARFDRLKMAKAVAKSFFRPMRPADFEMAYLSISAEQGEDLHQLIKDRKLKNIVEFGTSFGISTLYLAKGVMESGGHIITTELLASKAQQAIKNFKQAGVDELIEVRTGDAMETLKGHDQPIDLLFLDGWKDLYLPLFNMLESNFHKDTIIYVDNANMADSQAFLATVNQSGKYHLQPQYHGKVVLISTKS